MVKFKIGDYVWDTSKTDLKLGLVTRNCNYNHKDIFADWFWTAEGTKHNKQYTDLGANTKDCRIATTQEIKIVFPNYNSNIEIW